MLKDHASTKLSTSLGSASVLTNASGNIVSGADIRYYPFDEARSDTLPMVTDKLFTGQRLIEELGIPSFIHFKHITNGNTPAPNASADVITRIENGVTYTQS